MNVQVTLEGSGTVDDLINLRYALTQEDEIRGHVELREAPVTPGSLGFVSDAIEIALQSSGAAAASAWALVHWIRSRSSDVNLKITAKDGRSIELVAQRLKSATPLQLKEIAQSLARELEAGEVVENESGQT